MQIVAHAQVGKENYDIVYTTSYPGTCETKNALVHPGAGSGDYYLCSLHHK